MQTAAFAKLNLSLDILGRRPDGYHDLRMVMHTVDLSDSLTLERTHEPGIQVRTGLSFLPTDEKNLAAAAALAFATATGQTVDGLRIAIDKHIPVCAGLAGGSSDAAAVLKALNAEAGCPLTAEALRQVGATVGSDVPYCLLGGTALAEGRGELLTPLTPLPPCTFVLCKPPFPISTPELFSRADSVRLHCHPDTAGLLAALEAGDLAGVARRMYNVFEDVLEDRRRGEIEAIKGTLLDCGALGAVMSGSGPTVFGVFADTPQAQRAQARLVADYPQTFLAKSV